MLPGCQPVVHFLETAYAGGNLRGLLLGYWALMALVPVPNLGTGHYEAGRNLANYVDSIYLPLSKWNGNWDPEGLLSTLPAIGTCLLGVFAGLFLRNETVPAQKKVFWLFAAGVISLLLGLLWGTWFPIIKQIWTSSYVMVTGGLSVLLSGVVLPDHRGLEVAKVGCAIHLDWLERHRSLYAFWLGRYAIKGWYLQLPQSGHPPGGRVAQNVCVQTVFRIGIGTVVVGLVIWLAYVPL